MNTSTPSDTQIASQLIKQTDITIIEAARIVLEITEEFEKPTLTFSDLKEIVRLGVAKKKEKIQSQPLGLAAQIYLQHKKNLRPRTLKDIQQLFRRLFKHSPSTEDKLLSDFTTDDVYEILESIFFTDRQKIKARSILSALFNYAIKREWCRKNPFKTIILSPPHEYPIRALTPMECTTLMQSAWDHEEGACTAAVALMLYAGIRPTEVQRLAWKQINEEENIITLFPRHSKTGGCRHVSITPVLKEWLRRCRQRFQPIPQTPICPPGWDYKWRRVRKKAGWAPELTHWIQNCLRHTFASYHLKYYKNIPLLQMEMGHSSPGMLRSRYLNMEGVTTLTSKLFWQPYPAKTLKKIK